MILLDLGIFFLLKFHYIEKFDYYKFKINKIRSTNFQTLIKFKKIKALNAKILEPKKNLFLKSPVLI